MGGNVGMLKNLFNCNTVMRPRVILNDKKPQFNPKGRVVPLIRSTPENEGIKSEYILNYLKEISDEKSINLHNLLILKNGKIISGTEFGNSDLSIWKMSFSATKSIVSIAIGMLVDEGKLSIKAPIIEFFPEYETPLSRIKLRAITVENLLTMSTGSTFNEFACMSSGEWEKSFFKSAFSIRPGGTFNYNSLNTYVLSAIVKKVSRETLSDYLKPRLFDPLEIFNYYFEKSNSMVEKGGWGLYIIPEDFAKIGQMLLNRGIWNGKRILSERWIDLATKRQITVPASFGNYDYGYHVWVGKNANSFLFNGMFGQNVLGFFDSNLLIVTNGGNDDFFQKSRFFEITEKYFSGDIAESLPNDKKSYRKLIKFNDTLKLKIRRGLLDIIFPYRKTNKFVKHFNLLNLEFKTLSTNAASIGFLPKILQIVQNNYSSGFVSARFYIKDKQLILCFKEQSAQFNVPLGIGEFKISEIDYYGEKYLIAAGIEQNEDCFTINIDFLETFSSRKLIFKKENGLISLTLEERPGLDLIKQSVEVLKNSFPKNKFITNAVEKIKNDFIIAKFQNILQQKVFLSK